MRWPWQRRSSDSQLVWSWADQKLAFARARALGNGQFEIQQIGVLAEPREGAAGLLTQLNGLRLRGGAPVVMLRPGQYFFLQVPAPAVPADEMRSAARYQIRDLVDVHIDDLTVDVLQIGGGQQRINPQVFVVAGRNESIRAAMDLAKGLDWDVSVIDVQETAQRNLQTRLSARAADSPTGAELAIVIADGKQALLTICSQGELYYTRKLDLPEGFLGMEWSAASSMPDVPEGYTPVTEYVPDYAGGGSYGGQAAQTDADRAQRLVLEVQRTLDLWDRTWTSLPLRAIQVYAGERTPELCEWLARELGQAVQPLEVESQFPGWDACAPEDRRYCFPLLGLLLRDAET